MNPGIIFIGLAMLFVAALFVSNPLLYSKKYKKKHIAQETHKVSAETEYKAALKALSDLDYDFQSGRVTQEDYTNLRSELMLEASKYVQSPLALNQSEKDDVIEKLIQNRKAS